MALHRPRLHGLETRKGDGVVGVLHEQSRNQCGGIKADFHTSKAADFRAAQVSLFIQKRPDIPDGWRDSTGTDKNAAFLGEGRCRACRSQAYAVGFNGNFQIVSWLQSKAIPDGFRHDNPAHSVEGDLHGKMIAISQWVYQ